MKTNKKFITKIILLVLLNLVAAKAFCNNLTSDNLLPNQGVYYSIFVRSFADSDGDGIGDFNGITQKLDYLKELGITGIWLLPIYPSPSYHGYDVDDYYNVNPDYGTMEDFENLVLQAKQHNINIILDITFNHSSVTNPWFIASKDPKNPHHSWYNWVKEGNKKYNLNSSIWNHNVWNKNSDNPKWYYSGLFSDSMPDFNVDNKDLRKEFSNIIKFWMDKGVTGFRFDAGSHVYNQAKVKKETDTIACATDFWSEIIGYTKEQNPQSFCVAEVWENARIRAEYLKAFDSDFHFDMGSRIINALKTQKDSRNYLAEELAYDYKVSFKNNQTYTDAPFLTNHDQIRVASQLSGDIERCKAAASLYLLTQGTPFIYYGEELGMKSGNDDPSKRTGFIWEKESSYNCTWKEDSYNTNTEDLATQAKDNNSLFNYYKKIINYRTSKDTFVKGIFRSNPISASNISSWIMEYENQKSFIFVNVTGYAQDFDLSDDYSEYTLDFSSHNENSYMNNKIHIAPYGTMVLSN